MEAEKLAGIFGMTLNDLLNGAEQGYVVNLKNRKANTKHDVQIRVEKKDIENFGKYCCIF